MMKSIRKIPRNLLANLSIGIVIFVLQLIPIWWLQPNPEDFVPIKTVSGIYEFKGGDSPAARPTTSVAGNFLYCSGNVWGEGTACPQRLNNKRVTAEVYGYRYMFGHAEVTLKIIAMDGDKFSVSTKEISRAWTQSSYLMAIFIAVVGGIIFSTAQKIRALNVGDKNGK